jgi:hypothetical protein
LPDALEELRAGNVPHGRALDLLLLFRREIECVAQEYVRIAVISCVARDDRIESFGKANFLHLQNAC